jgi:hypothetical protein
MDLRGDNGACFMHTAQQVHLHYQACFMQFFLFWAFTPISQFAKHGLRGLCCVCFFFFFCLSMMLVTLNVMRSSCKLLQLSQKCSAQKRNECTINTSCAIMGHCVWESCARLVVVCSINLWVETQMGLQIMLWNCHLRTLDSALLFSDLKKLSSMKLSDIWTLWGFCCYQATKGCFYDNFLKKTLSRLCLEEFEVWCWIMLGQWLHPIWIILPIEVKGKDFCNMTQCKEN